MVVDPLVTRDDRHFSSLQILRICLTAEKCRNPKSILHLVKTHKFHFPSFRTTWSILFLFYFLRAPTYDWRETTNDIVKSNTNSPVQTVLRTTWIILFFLFARALTRDNKWQQKIEYEFPRAYILLYYIKFPGLVIFFSRVARPKTDNKKSPFCSQSADEVKSKASPCQRLRMDNF